MHYGLYCISLLPLILRGSSLDDFLPSRLPLTRSPSLLCIYKQEVPALDCTAGYPLRAYSVPLTRNLSSLCLHKQGDPAPDYTAGHPESASCPARLSLPQTSLWI